MKYKDMTGQSWGCFDCKHYGKRWDEEPCEECTPKHCGYEECQNENQEKSL